MKKNKLEDYVLFRVWQAIFWIFTVIWVGGGIILGFTEHSVFLWFALGSAVILTVIWKAVTYIIVGKIKQNV